MWRRGWLGGLVLVLAAGLPAQVAQAQVDLKWKFKEGDKVFIETVSDMKQAMTVMGQNIEFDMKQTQVVSLSVKKKSSDGVVLEQKIESIKAEGGPLVQAAIGAFTKMEGAVLTLTLDANNKVQKVEGFREMLDKIIGDNPQAQQMMKGMLNEDTMKQQFEATFSFLPDKPVRPGDKWERTSTLSLGPLGSFTTKSAYTYDGKETLNGKPLDKITSTATYTYAPPKPDQAAGLPFKVVKGDLKGESPKSTYWFDAASGRVVQQKSGVRFSGSLTADVMGNNIDMTLDQNQDISVRVLDKNPVEK
jgi:hypothetical protein